MPTGVPEVGIPIGTAGDGCWLDSSKSGNGWMKRGITHQKLVPIKILPPNDSVPRTMKVITILCVRNSQSGQLPV